MKILPLIISSAVILMSCDKKETKAGADKTTPSEIATSAETAPETAGTAPATAVASNPTQPQTAKSGAKPALNPAHGEPFHRCDISVGAPIDSAPQQNAAPQQMPQQSASNNNFNTSPIAPSVAAPVSAPQATGPKPALNPAHGEPHHRCDLQVGAPLT